MCKVNANFADNEKIGYVFVCKSRWTPENGFLTPTLKVKRQIVEETFQSMLEKVIKQGSLVVWETDLEKAEVA